MKVLALLIIALGACGETDVGSGDADVTTDTVLEVCAIPRHDCSCDRAVLKACCVDSGVGFACTENSKWLEFRGCSCGAPECGMFSFPVTERCPGFE